MKRCKWCNLNNPKYVEYHDHEWGVLHLDDSYLFEMLLLESFQAGLSWECVLNKREAFRLAYDSFDVKKIALYGEAKIKQLKENDEIIRNSRKIIASILNAQVFLSIQKEFGSFEKYLRTFWDGKILIECDCTSNGLSDAISFDLKKRGMQFVGTTIIYSFLQAIGIIDSHEKECFLYSNMI